MNNYDTNKNGLSIEFQFNMDVWLGQHYCQESLEEITELSNSWLYTQHGNLSNEFEIRIKPRQKMKLINFIIKEEILESYSKNELLKMDFEELEGFIESYFYNCCSSIENELDLLHEYRIDTTLDDYFIHYSRGYSQGDYAEVYTNMKEACKQWGSTWDNKLEQSIEKEIDNLLWDSPIYCSLEIEGKEYYIEEYQGQYFEGYYEKEEVIATIIKSISFDFNKEQLKEIKSFLEEEIDDTLKYV